MILLLLSEAFYYICFRVGEKLFIKIEQNDLRNKNKQIYPTEKHP